jgi:hypothetical protein
MFSGGDRSTPNTEQLGNGSRDEQLAETIGAIRY